MSSSFLNQGFLHFSFTFSPLWGRFLPVCVKEWAGGWTNGQIRWIDGWMDVQFRLACLSFVPISLNTSDHFCISRGMCHICISSFQVSSLTKTSKYCLNKFTLICHFPLKISVSKTTFNNFSWSQVYIYPHDLPAFLPGHDPVPTRL